MSIPCAAPADDPLDALIARQCGVLLLAQTRMPRRTRLARSLIDAEAWMPDDAGACAVVAAGVQQRLVRPGELRAALDRRPSLRRRRLLLRTIGDIDGGAQSLSEIDLVRLCRRHRLPRPSQQVARRDSEGRQRWLDAYWAEWGLHVEVDGAVHVEARQWWADMRRQNEVWIGGDRLLRFPAYVLRREPETVAAQVRTALRAAGWPGSPRRKGVRGGNASFDGGDEVALLDHVALVHGDLAHCAGDLADHRYLHLHRLEDHQRVSVADLVTGRGDDLPDIGHHLGPDLLGH
jgi:very-short-patch-repair endonuclease